MVDESNVWMVRLRRGGATEIQGALTLEPEAIVFTDGRGDRTAIPISSVRKVHRRRGSPILMVTHGETGRREHVAFFFAQPPPLSPDPTAAVTPGPPGPLGSRSSGRTTRRRVIRGNVSYLGSASVSKKGEIKAWVGAIRDRMGKSRPTPR